MEYRNPKELTAHPVSSALYGDNHIDGLVDSVREYGILVPLTITDKNVVISGHRRWRSALQLKLDKVSVEVKIFQDEWAEKQAILDYNKQREKTFIQKMNEAQLLKEIYSAKAKLRTQQAPNEPVGIKKSPKEMFPSETRDLLGKQVDIGSGRTYDKAEKIWDKAQEGDEKAQSLVKDIDAGDKTISKAYNELFDKAHVSHNAGENEWYTPKEYIELAVKVMGHIDLDPASTKEANTIINAKKYYDKEKDGLTQDWIGNIWMNPPYAQPLIDRFSSKLVEEYKNGNAKEAIVLVNNATETKWFQLLCSVASGVCFPVGRVKFWAPNKVSAPLQGQAVIYIGNKADIFLGVFKSMGVTMRVDKNGEA